MENPELKALAEEVREFVKERDWEKFHTPKNLSMALAVEAAELMEHFQWTNERVSVPLSSDQINSISQELADIFIYLLRLSDVLEIDLVAASRKKLQTNRTKYPAQLVRGSSKKYDQY